MKQVVALWFLCGPYVLSAQFFSGYYESSPQMEGFDHFEIDHEHGDLGRYDAAFTLHAYVDHQEMWAEETETITGKEADYFIEKYGEERAILSVHKMKILWDGLEWEFFLLSYLDKDDHGKFIVVEELFTDETEKELKEVKRYTWSRAHHLSLRGLVKHRE